MLLFMCDFVVIINDVNVIVCVIIIIHYVVILLFLVFNYLSTRCRVFLANHKTTGTIRSLPGA